MLNRTHLAAGLPRSKSKIVVEIFRKISLFIATFVVEVAITSQAQLFYIISKLQCESTGAALGISNK